MWYNVTVGSYEERTIAINAASPEVASAIAIEEARKLAKGAYVFQVEFQEVEVADEQREAK